MNRLLLLSCSRKKSSGSELLPAYERYDGPAFRVLRRYLNSSAYAPTIRIISAEFGLIPYDLRIPYYDRRMTTERAHELQPQIAEELNKLLVIGNRKNKKDVFIYSGKNYLKALEGSSLFSSTAVVKKACGTPGRRLTDLYSWLYGEPPICPQRPAVLSNNIRIRGIQVKLTAEEALDVARCAIEEGSAESGGHRSWHVLVDEKQVSPKWLIKLITGLPLSSFHTDDARRVLRQLGIQMHASKR